MPNPTITQHGLVWIADGASTECPECKSLTINCKVERYSTDGLPYLLAKCICTNCGCQFTFKRNLLDDPTSE